MRAQLYALLKMADEVFIDGYECSRADNGELMGFVSEDDDEPVIYFLDQEAEVSAYVYAKDTGGTNRTLSLSLSTELDDTYLLSDRGQFNYSYWALPASSPFITDTPKENGNA